VSWHFAVKLLATVIQKETWKNPKLSTLEELEIETYLIPELGFDQCNITIVDILFDLAAVNRQQLFSV